MNGYHQTSSGPAAVVWSAQVAWRGTAVILRVLVWVVALWARAVMAWARLVIGRPGEDKVMVLRRRKWAVLTALAVPLAVGTLFAPGVMLHTVGFYPMVASLPVFGFSAFKVRRLTRQARTGAPAASPMPAGPPAIMGDYQPTARSIELEQALGHTLWQFAAHGLPVDTAIVAAKAMPHRSQLWLLTVAEASLAALGRLEADSQHGLAFTNTEAAVWLFPFCQALRAATGLPSNVTNEPHLH